MALLALLRHAKAVKDDPRGDHARPLSVEGRAAAELVGERLRALLPPDPTVVTSDARRTLQTTEHAFPADAGAHVRVEPSLYAARPDVLLDCLRALPSDVPAAVLVGHNPGISELASSLAGGGDPSALAHLSGGLATAEAVVFELAGHWADLQPGTGRVCAVLIRNDGDD